MSNIYSLSRINIQKNSFIEKEELTNATKDKLRGLGIDVSSVSSEYEAKKVIAKEENQKTENVQVASTGTEERLYERLRALAAKLGITISKNENIQTIFTKIEVRLKELEQNSNNPNINFYRSEFEIIKNEFKNITAGETAILNAMDLIGQANRAVLGI